MPFRAWPRAVVLSATLLVSCTNDYESLRFPRRPAGSEEPGPDAQSTGGARGKGGAQGTGGAVTTGGALGTGGAQITGGARGSGGGGPDAAPPDVPTNDASVIVDAAFDVTSD